MGRLPHDWFDSCQLGQSVPYCELVSLAMWENSHTGLLRVRQTDRT